MRKTLTQEADLDPGEVAVALVALAMIWDDGADPDTFDVHTRAVMEKVHAAWLKVYGN